MALWNATIIGKDFTLDFVEVPREIAESLAEMAVTKGLQFYSSMTTGGKSEDCIGYGLGHSYGSDRKLKVAARNRIPDNFVRFEHVDYVPFDPKQDKPELSFLVELMGAYLR